MDNMFSAGSRGSIKTPRAKNYFNFKKTNPLNTLSTKIHRQKDPILGINSALKYRAF